MSTPFLTSAIVTTRHGFFGREGGVSDGLYASLNTGLGSRDVRENILENRKRVRDALGAARLLTLYQIHSAKVVTVTEPWTHERQPQADALVTNLRGTAIGVLTADCAPVLFVDAGAGVIGAAHAGWKGAHAGVLEATVAAMEQLGAKRSAIAAAIGPCIAQESYEVGPEFRARLVEEAHAQARLFVPSRRDGYFQFDLGGYVDMKLRAAGLEAIEQLAFDTCADEARFFSYRRACLRGEPDHGRQISAILLTGEG